MGAGPAGSGSSRGTVNQKVLPAPALLIAPICPPRTATCTRSACLSTATPAAVYSTACCKHPSAQRACSLRVLLMQVSSRAVESRQDARCTCLLQMERPRPVPPLLRGRFISSSVPCTATSLMMGLLQVSNIPQNIAGNFNRALMLIFHGAAEQCLTQAKLSPDASRTQAGWQLNRACLHVLLEEALQALGSNATACVGHLEDHPVVRHLAVLRLRPAGTCRPE